MTNPYASPQNTFQVDDVVDFELQVDERLLIEAATTEMEKRGGLLHPVITIAVLIGMLVWIGAFKLINIKVTTGSAFLLCSMAFLSGPLLGLAVMQWQAWRRRKHYAVLARSAIAELPVQHPQLKDGVWKCTIDRAQFIIRTAEGEVNWSCSDLRWLAILRRPEQAAIFLKTPNVTLQIPKRMFSPELFGAIAAAIFARVPQEVFPVRWF